MQEDQCMMLKSKGTVCDVPVRSKASSLRVWSSFTYRRNDNDVAELSTNQENNVSVGRLRDGRNYPADFNVRLCVLISKENMLKITRIMKRKL